MPERVVLRHLTAHIRIVSGGNTPIHLVSVITETVPLLYINSLSMYHETVSTYPTESVMCGEQQQTVHYFELPKLSTPQYDGNEGSSDTSHLHVTLVSMHTFQHTVQEGYTLKRHLRICFEGIDRIENKRKSQSTVQQRTNMTI